MRAAVLKSVCVIFAFVLSLNLSAADQTVVPAESRPKVIVLGQFVLVPTQIRAELLVAMRDVVASELLKKYNCVILSRNAGMTIRTEREIGKMDMVVNDGKKVGELPAADYAVYGNAYWGNNGEVNLSLICEDMNSRLQSLTKEEFTDIETPATANAVVASIAKILNLKERAPAEKPASKTDERWAVLPFSRLDTRDSISFAMPDIQLSSSSIIALQDSGLLKAIVDRDEMTNLIKELKLESIAGSNEGAASKIARILGADMIITGLVSPIETDNKYGNKSEKTKRLDMLLINAKTAVVVDSASTVCKIDELNKKAGDLALELAGRKHETPVLSPSTPEQRKREREHCISTFYKVFSWSKSDPALIPVAVSIVESAYMLSDGREKETLDLAGMLADFSADAYIITDFRGRQMRDLTYALVDSLSEKYKNEHPEYHLKLATASKASKNYDEAFVQLSLAEKRGVKPTHVNKVRGNVFMAKKDYKSAAEAYLAANDYIMATEAYAKAGDKDSEYKYLKKINYSTPSTILMDGNQPYLVLDMIREKEGAAAALQFYMNYDGYLKALPEVQLRKALCHADLGEKIHAQQIMYYLKKGYEKNNMLISKESYVLIQKKLAELDSELGPDKCKMKKLADIRTIDKKYKIYIQPIDGAHRKDIGDAKKMVEDFTGLSIVILPDIPTPTNYTYDKARGQYNAEGIINAVRYSVPVQNDGLLFFIVLSHDIYADNLRYIYAAVRPKKGTAVFSSCRIYKDTAKKLAIQICDHFNYVILENAAKCASFSCINSVDGSTAGIRNKDFHVCVECEEYLKKINVEKANRLFVSPDIDYNSFTKDRITLLNQYKAQVETVLKENKSEIEK